MKYGITLVVSIILSTAIAFAVSKYIATTPPEIPHNETSYERILRTGTLRCGYEYWDGAVMRDEKGQLYGPWVDLTNALGAAMNLKIEWTEHVSWSDMSAALKANHVDAICDGPWASATKAKEMSLTEPMAYQVLEAFVRNDDHRFDDDINKINDPNVRIVVIDNDNTEFLAQQDFPKAQRIGLGTLNGTDSEEMMNVMTGKADICFSVAGLWQQFNKTNPGKIRRLNPDKKLRVFGLIYAVDNADPRLQQLMNAAEHEVQNSGQLDKILDKANLDYPDMFIKPLKPFP